MANETIADIVREMREHASGDATETYYDRFAWSVLCDRIEAAAKRENDRLRAALEPVLACKTLSAEGSMPNYSGCLDAVHEAKMIFKEGYEK